MNCAQAQSTPFVQVKVHGNIIHSLQLLQPWPRAASENPLMPPHESGPPQACTICGFKFHCKEARIAHTGRQCATCGLRFDCREVHSAHMDWHFLVNSRKRKEAAEHSHALRQCATCGSEFRSDQEHRAHMDWHFYRNKRIKLMSGAGKEAQDEANAVPADESQDVCPVCGEGFERFFSEEADDWMCKNAVYMNVPAGCFYEDMEKSCRGPILHVNCR